MTEEQGTPEPLPRGEASILSPLRYPGSKRRLASYVAETLRLNGLRPKLLVEPFAGGASVALQLLNDGLVESVGLAERDPLVASFWKVVFSDAEWLIEQVERLDVTVSEWQRFRESTARSHKERALACLFLNRTSFSGIIARSAGPLGGHRQRSRYKIDCRFSVATITRRIRQAADLRDRVVFVDRADWAETIAKVEAMEYEHDSVFYYLDPPFYRKAGRLYNFYFEHEDHVRLRDAVATLEHPWFLSYDPAETIFNLYSHNGTEPTQIELLYSASANNSPAAAQELAITNLQRLPKQTRLWRSSEEWGRGPTADEGSRTQRKRQVHQGQGGAPR